MLKATLMGLLLICALSITDKEILQQTLNGAFEENKLADPTTIVPCFDDDSAHKTVVFIGKLLDTLAKASISDASKISQMIKDFSDSLPESVKKCLDGNKEFEALGVKYNITNQTDTSALEKKVIAYVSLHFLTVRGWFKDLDNLWKAGKYYQVGYDGAAHAHTVLNSPRENPLEQQVLKELIRGLILEDSSESSSSSSSSESVELEINFQELAEKLKMFRLNHWCMEPL